MFVPERTFSLVAGDGVVQNLFTSTLASALQVHTDASGSVIFDADETVFVWDNASPTADLALVLPQLRPNQRVVVKNNTPLVSGPSARNINVSSPVTSQTFVIGAFGSTEFMFSAVQNKLYMLA